MAKPPVIEDKQIEHLIKATAAYSRVPARDTALLLTLYGTALAVTELATIASGTTWQRMVLLGLPVPSDLPLHTAAKNAHCSGQTSGSWPPLTHTSPGDWPTGKVGPSKEVHTVA